jgi:alkylation response protein AidB-like acyl-CoA dehydrogenase
MDFSFSKEQEAIRKFIRDFCKKEIAPVAEQIEKEGKIPEDLKTKLVKFKLFGIPFEKEYGGSGAGFVGATIALEEISKVSGAISMYVGCNYLTGIPIHLYGTDEQKKQYLGQLCEGKLIGSFAFTEAATGSDPTSITSEAKLEGSDYIINGSKRFITGADFDGPIVFFAKDEGGVSGFIGQKNAPGYSIPKPWEKMGMHGMSLVDIYFDNYRVPASNLLGHRGKGYLVLLDTIAIGKLDSAVIMMGLAEAALEEAVKYANERTVRGKPISGMQSIQNMIADMAIKLEAAKWMAYRVAWMIDQKDPAVKVESAKAKSFITEAAADVARIAIRVHGAYGYVTEFKIERLFRDIALGEIVEGTSELQKVIVSHGLIK